MLGSYIKEFIENNYCTFDLGRDHHWQWQQKTIAVVILEITKNDYLYKDKHKEKDDENVDEKY